MAKKWTKKEIKTIEQMLKEGKSVNYISTKFGITEENLRMIMSRNNLKVLVENRSGKSKLQSKREQDIATRIRILKGEEIRITEPLAKFTDEQLHKWKNNTVECCDKFCRDVLNVELQDYQLLCIEKMLKTKRFVGVMGRQIGKDFLLSCFVVWQVIINSNSKILLVSASQRASDLLYNRILSFIGQREELFDSVSKSNMEKCIFKNNSELWSLPASGQIRGQTEVTHVIVNEAHEVPDEAFSAIEPMLAIKHGHLYIFSTPRGCIGRFWEAFNNPMFSKVHLPSTANKYIPKEYFELQKKTMDSLEYDMEINANFQESLNSFFKLSSIQKCTQDYSLRQSPEPDKEYYCGIDWGRISDSSVITILSKNEDELKVENIIELTKTPFPEQVALIKKIHDDFKFKKIIPEYNGLGIAPCDDLIKEIGESTVQPFKSSLKSKEESYSMFRKQIEDVNLVIPNHTKLQYELRTFVYELTATGAMKLHHLANSSDDFVDSLMFAVWGTKEENEFCFDFLEIPVKQIY